MTTAPRQFPDGFLWGASTAAHQIEGSNINTDWWVREHTPGSGVAEPSGDAADSFHRYPEDIALLAAAGLNAYRFSIEWARIEPEEGLVSRAMLQHYRRMIQTTIDAGLEPVVTIHHFTSPRWFAESGGWHGRDAVDRFARYVETVLPILRDVRRIVTINEPNILSMMHGKHEGDLAAIGLPAPDDAVSEALVAAHRRSREILTQLPGAATGWAIAGQAYHAEPGCEAEMLAFRHPREDLFLEAARGDDFVGVQAYLRTFIGKDGAVPVREGVETTLTGWEYFPPALGIAARHAWDLTGGAPVLVTENGIATADDARRIDYTHDALLGLHDAMADGVDVQGYLHWSALDNYEWGSYKPTFGLIGWDAETFERTPKPSAAWLGGIARSGLLTHPDPAHIPYTDPQ
ncbi:family 1 glycosylhydrolase [Leifsonia sp. NPDC080035]|uniref:Family 1 glycosylhydrolase n=1 Tax=Leifsonia sp. NPDC080035 TaxID=3143936 RepID=A0AAU7G7L1_9MICO